MQPDEDQNSENQDVSESEGALPEGHKNTAEDTSDDQAVTAAEGNQKVASDDRLDPMTAINEVELDAYAILGTASMPVSQLLRMGRGAVVELETGVGDQINLTVNGNLIARGEVVVVEDRVAVKITDLVGRDQATDKAG